MREVVTGADAKVRKNAPNMIFAVGVLGETRGAWFLSQAGYIELKDAKWRSAGDSLKVAAAFVGKVGQQAG